MALWQMFGDKMENHRRSLAEVESPYFIFGAGFRALSDNGGTRGVRFERAVAGSPGWEYRKPYGEYPLLMLLKSSVTTWSSM
jgi:hypothetical protein